MKILNTVLSVLILAAAVSAQMPPDLSGAPDLEVVKLKWHRAVRNPALDEDPFRANDEQREFERDLRINSRRNRDRAAEGKPVVATSRPQRPVETASHAPSERYVYSVKIKNTGAKTIRTLEWEYVFYEPKTQEEVGRHRYTSNVNLRPGKTGEVVGESTSTPTGVVDVSKAGKELRDQYSEKVVIHRVEYSDGSSWQRSTNR